VLKFARHASSVNALEVSPTPETQLVITGISKTYSLYELIMDYSISREKTE
jgi:hypothetical protein